MALYCGEDQTSVKILYIQKNVIRLITGLKRSESYRMTFKENRILTVTSLYVLEVMCFIQKEKGNLKHNFAIHEHNKKVRQI
jgi:hypothetical protein